MKIETFAGGKDCRRAEQPSSRVYWITGLSGSGKSTLASRLQAKRLAAGRETVLIDGDLLREMFGGSLGHSLDQRHAAAWRTIRACKAFADQGYDVVCATISMFEDVRQWGRENIQAFCEIYLRVPMDVLRMRDPKGLYSGNVTDVVGIDLPWDEPVHADLTIENYGTVTPDSALQLILGVGNSPKPTVTFGTKAETLQRLSGLVTGAAILPQADVARRQWTSHRTQELARLTDALGSYGALAVRSSFIGEDGPMASNAGRYLSALNVATGAMAEAIDKVFASNPAPDDLDRVLVQPYVADATSAGVIFTREPNTGAPYYIFNLAPCTGDTTIVTGGRSGETETLIYHRNAEVAVEPRLEAILALARNLEGLLGTDKLDIEYVQSASRGLVLLQVRPLSEVPTSTVTDKRHGEAVTQIARKIEAASRPHPDLLGKSAIFGVMPDWNPAEIIGLRPRPLALSLYRKLVTDGTWAYQRDNYGYRNLRSFPLMLNLQGLPYIDVRVSFNSFIPKTVPDPLARRLVDYYLDTLRRRPELHDKVEFDIVFSCYTLDLDSRLKALPSSEFSANDLAALAQHLRRLTNAIVGREKSVWRTDLAKFDELKRRHATILASNLDPVSSIYWLLEYCERYGTLPFAGLARAAFIGTQMLHSLVAVDAISQEECHEFLASLSTVSSDMQADFDAMTQAEFLKKYGHLRPGTYDIRSPRYDEGAEHYFDWGARSAPGSRAAKPTFRLSLERQRYVTGLLRESGLQFNAEDLFCFIRAAIEGREYGKFVFTETLSSALTALGRLADGCGFSLDDMSYADIGCIRQLYSGSEAAKSVIGRSIERGREQFSLTSQLSLPPLIIQPDDAWSFAQPPTQPNFVTQLSASGAAARPEDHRDKLKGAILFVESADPGYDWIFSCGISGFVTKFGGANSHMAIRANEMRTPAVIGAGEKYFARWSGARRLTIDCANRLVEVHG